MPEKNGPPDPHDCKEHYRLASEWSRAVRAYADAVRRYVNIPQSSDVETARIAAEKARLDLEAHQGAKSAIADNAPRGASVDIAARGAGFKSAETYERAKTVVAKGTPELIAAMDSGDIA